MTSPTNQIRVDFEFPRLRTSNKINSPPLQLNIPQCLGLRKLSSSPEPVEAHISSPTMSSEVSQTLRITRSAFLTSSWSIPAVRSHWMRTSTMTCARIWAMPLTESLLRIARVTSIGIQLRVWMICRWVCLGRQMKWGGAVLLRKSRLNRLISNPRWSVLLSLFPSGMVS